VAAIRWGLLLLLFFFWCAAYPHPPLFPPTPNRGNGGRQNEYTSGMCFMNAKGMPPALFSCASFWRQAGMLYCGDSQTGAS
jgi:hypothetical protein